MVNGSGPPQPEVITRQAWGADEGMRKGPIEFAPISKLVVHHTVTPNDDPDPAQTVRAVYAYHTRHNGWNDVGYNFLVDQQGRVYEGRFARPYGPGETPTGEDEAGRGVIGAHVKGNNPGTVGVAVLGDYSGGYVPPGPALDAVVRLLAWKAPATASTPRGRHRTPPPTVPAGRSPTSPATATSGATGCPGGRLYERLPEIRQRVADTIGGAPAPPPPPPPAPPVPPPPPPVPEFPGFWSAGAEGRVQAFGDARSAGDLGGRTARRPHRLPGGHTDRPGVLDGRGRRRRLRLRRRAVPRVRRPGSSVRRPCTSSRRPPARATGCSPPAERSIPFGDAALPGPGVPLPVAAVGLAATPTGQGYWVATADAQVFAFGDAVLQAATGASPPAVGAGTGPPKPGAPTVAIAASPDGKGYWLLARDGGVFSFGVPFHGSVADRQPYERAVSLEATSSGAGYYVAGGDGAVFAFGDADRRRERGPGGGETVVDVAFRPTGARPAVSAVSAAPAPPAAPEPPKPAPAAMI